MKLFNLIIASVTIVGAFHVGAFRLVDSVDEGLAELDPRSTALPREASVKTSPSVEDATFAIKAVQSSFEGTALAIKPEESLFKDTSVTQVPPPPPQCMACEWMLNACLDKCEGGDCKKKCECQLSKESKFCQSSCGYPKICNLETRQSPTEDSGPAQGSSSYLDQPPCRTCKSKSEFKACVYECGGSRDCHNKCSAGENTWNCRGRCRIPKYWKRDGLQTLQRPEDDFPAQDDTPSDPVDNTDFTMPPPPPPPPKPCTLCDHEFKSCMKEKCGNDRYCMKACRCNVSKQDKRCRRHCGFPRICSGKTIQTRQLPFADDIPAQYDHIGVGQPQQSPQGCVLCDWGFNSCIEECGSSPYCHDVCKCRVSKASYKCRNHCGFPKTCKWAGIWSAAFD